MQERYTYLLNHFATMGELQRGLDKGWLDDLARSCSSYCPLKQSSNLVGASEGRFRSTCHTAIRISNGAKIRVFSRVEKSEYIKPYSASWLWS